MSCMAHRAARQRRHGAAGTVHAGLRFDANANDGNGNGGGTREVTPVSKATRFAKHLRAGA